VIWFLALFATFSVLTPWVVTMARKRSRDEWRSYDEAHGDEPPISHGTRAARRLRSRR
jgi:hypothetical protein